MNKLAVISGATRGIGRAIAEKFAANGFDIITCARTKKDLEKVCEMLEKKYSVKVDYVLADLSQREDVNRFGGYVLSLNRPIDVLVNNVGYFTSGGVTDAGDGKLEEMMAINLYSAYYLTKKLIAEMKRQRAGHIFSICSVASLMTYPQGGLYSMSKFAMLGFSKALRQEVMDFGIRVTAVMPGATLTDSWTETTSPSVRFIKPSDIAETVYGAYSLSPQAVVEELIIRPQLGDL